MFTRLDCLPKKVSSICLLSCALLHSQVSGAYANSCWEEGQVLEQALMAQSLFFGEDSIELRRSLEGSEQELGEGENPAQSVLNSENLGFRNSFLTDALNGVADPFSGQGASSTGIRSFKHPLTH